MPLSIIVFICFFFLLLIFMQINTSIFSTSIWVRPMCKWCENKSITNAQAFGTDGFFPLLCSIPRSLPKKEHSLIITFIHIYTLHQKCVKCEKKTRDRKIWLAIFLVQILLCYSFYSLFVYAVLLFIYALCVWAYFLLCFFFIQFGFWLCFWLCFCTVLFVCLLVFLF